MEKTKNSSLKKLFIATIVIVVIAAILILSLFLFKRFLPYKQVNYGNTYADSALQFKSKEDVNNYYTNLINLEKASASRSLSFRPGVMKSQNSVGVTTENSTMDHSKTNVQVEGIDEADIVKTNGKYIYKLNDNGLAVIEVEDANLTLKKELIFEGSYLAKGLFIYNNKLIVFRDKFEKMDDFSYYYLKENTSEILIYNIVDIANPILEKHVAYIGSYVDVRLKENKLYFAYNFYFGYGIDYNNSNCPLPKRYEGDGKDVKMEDFALDKIFYFEGIPYFNYAIVGVINLDDNSLVDKAYFATGEMLYMSHNYVYLTSTDYGKQVFKNGLNTKVEYEKNQTRIVRLELESLKLSAVGKVEGKAINKYCLDEYNNHLRLATTTNWSDYSNVFVLDAKLETVGKITNIAPGESIYSARFDKETGSIVTFKRVDPLYKLNLTDPKNPKISDGLKKEGVSFYLHNLNEKYTVGVGRESDADGRLTGMEIVLYNMEGAEAVIAHKLVIAPQGYAYSEALYDPHAFLIDLDHNIFAFAISSRQYISNSVAEMLDKFYVFSFAEDKIVINKEISIPNSYESVRGVRIDKRLIVISKNQAVAYDIENEYTELYSLSFLKNELNK